MTNRKKAVNSATLKKTALIISAVLTSTAISCDEKTETPPTSEIPAQSQTEDIQPETHNLKIALVENINSHVLWQYIYPQIDKLNRSDSYDIEVEVYPFDEDDRLGDTAAQRLSMDILAGNVPDIISASPFQLNKFRKNGFLADISPLMENSEGNKREDFLDNVIESVEENGEIQILYPAFEVQTALAKTEFVGDNAENWTIQQAIDTYNSFNGDFLSYMYTKYDLRHYFFNGAMMNCVDFKNHTCDFNSGLTPIMEFLTNVPPMEKRFDTVVGNTYDNTALVKEVNIIGINSNYSNEILYSFKDEPFTFVGYPTDNGKGTITEIYNAFGIISNGSHKEQAWDALSQLVFSSEFQREISERCAGIPVKKSVVDNLFQASEYSNNSINAAVTMPDGSEMRLSDSQKQQLSDFLDNLKIEPFINPHVEFMIKEESDYVFDGNKSVDDCVNMLQNRFELYLSENQ